MDKWVMDKRLRYGFCVKDLHAACATPVRCCETAAVKGTEQEAEHRVTDGCPAGDNATAPASTRILGLVLSSQSYGWKQWSSSRPARPATVASGLLYFMAAEEIKWQMIESEGAKGEVIRFWY